MRPSDQVLAACVRWLDLLRRSNLDQAWALIGNDPRFADLSRTQYHAGLEWLMQRGLTVELAGSVTLGARARRIPPDEVGTEIMAEALELDPPFWLRDADELVREPGDIPHDAEELAAALGLTLERSLRSIRRAQHKVDLDSRQRVGALGEMALLSALEARWPGSTTHVSTVDDSAGYDIAVTLPGGVTHVEVKSTGRRGRLIVYLSRHEYDTARLDPAWRLVVVGLDSADQLAALATLRTGVLHSRAPTDTDPRAAWDSMRMALNGDDLEPGLRPIGDHAPLLVDLAPAFAWTPVDTSTQNYR